MVKKKTKTGRRKKRITKIVPMNTSAAVMLTKNKTLSNNSDTGGIVAAVNVWGDGYPEGTPPGQEQAPGTTRTGVSTPRLREV